MRVRILPAVPYEVVMKKEKWIVAFYKPIWGPTEYVGKFGCQVSLYSYLHFKNIDRSRVYTTILELPRE